MNSRNLVPVKLTGNRHLQNLISAKQKKSREIKNIMKRWHSKSTFAQRDGKGGVNYKANTPYKNSAFPYTKSEQGEGGGLKITDLERTYFMNGP